MNECVVIFVCPFSPPPPSPITYYTNCNLLHVFVLYYALVCNRSLFGWGGCSNRAMPAILPKHFCSPRSIPDHPPHQVPPGTTHLWKIMGTAPWQPDSSAVRKKMRKKRRRNQPLLDVSDASSGTLSETEELSAAPSHEEAVADNPTLKGLRYRRERAGSCWCGKIGGCACLDGCCFEDTPGVEECPCRVANYVPDNNLVAGDPAPCELCLEDGVRRPCCKHGFCRYCYEKSGNCPGCNRISVGADAGLFWEDVEKRGRGEVRDGEECRLCLRQGFCRKCCSEFYCSA
jgi:hypothetical protein